jgi:hypothetical protein
LLLLFVVPLALAIPAEASLVLDEAMQTSGTGLGTVNTILTVNNTPTESGCVAFDGTADVVGPAACPVGIAGGDEQTGESQTQTRTMEELGLTAAQQLRIVFNASEGGDSIGVDNLVLTIFGSDGTELFNSGPFAPIVFPATFQGTGTAGFVFRLDDTQAAAAQPFFAAQNRIGLAASLSATSSGNETFFVADFEGLEASVTEIPTMSSLGLVFLALLLAGAGIWMVLRRA